MPILEIVEEGSIARPVQEVRSQFADFSYHAKANVHPELKFTIQSQTGTSCRFWQEVSLLGIKQKDDVRNTVLANGEQVTEVMDGPNKGFRLHFYFQATGPNTTNVKVVATAPLNGFKIILKPLLKMAIRKTLLKAYEEDRRDLESGAYAAYLTKQRRA